jgi:hypothetical protein
MAKKIKVPTFDETIATLRGYGFDVGTGAAVAKPAGAVEITKYGCAAVIAPGGKEVAAAVVVKPGIVVNGEIGHVLDRGYQKFIKTPAAERPATAEHLRALHRFSEELRQTIGAISLYNESMGTVSDEYMYDRVKGRNVPESERPTPAWDLPVGAGTPGEVK